MIPQQEISPFNPGDGIIPPELTGREKEQRELKSCLARLQQKIAPSNNVIVCSPRGNGKTALLRWFERFIKEDNAKTIDTLWLTPDEIPTTELLLDQLAKSDWRAKLPTDLQISLGATVSPEALGVSLGEANLTLRAGTAQQQQFRNLVAKELTARCTKKPLVVIIDEAHTLDIETGRTLLNASQKTPAEAPFLLILAGTPGLQKQLQRMGATFWERSERLYPNLLSHRDAAKALIKPLEKYHITCEEDWLETIIQDAQGYPYFVQLWGDKLFDALKQRGQARIDQKITTQARSEVGLRKKYFYRDRYYEIKEARLASLATTLGTAFSGQPSLDEHQLEQLLHKAALPPEMTPEEAETILHDLGYIWQGDPDNESNWIPGIPSLMKYIEQRVTQSE
ncbi:MAG: AAA family ATPase [Gammaproteobacteria bacterium]|nr:AAA family ATPase [Gammaproteobacteria bacterium]MDE0158220.1 AAA family ATPase [Gammaproteobacteria bacterium]